MLIVGVWVFFGDTGENCESQLRKSVHICQSYYQTSSGLLFLGHGVESCPAVELTLSSK